MLMDTHSIRTGQPGQLGQLPRVGSVGQAVRFTTVSASRPGVRHTLVVMDGKVRHCGCEAWHYRRRCRHASRLQAFCDEFTEQEG